MTRRSSFRCRRTTSANAAGSRTAAKPPKKRPPLPLLPLSSCLSFVRTLLSMFFVDPSTPPYSTTFLHISLPFSLFLSPSFSLSSFEFGSLLWQKRHYSLFGASVLDNGWWMRRGESGERSPWSVGRMLTKMAFVKKGHIRLQRSFNDSLANFPPPFLFSLERSRDSWRLKKLFW